jgi:hypothetical protein
MRMKIFTEEIKIYRLKIGLLELVLMLTGHNSKALKKGWRVICQKLLPVFRSLMVIN